MKNKNTNYTFFDIINTIVTFFGVGNIRGCPGTWRSIATLPLWILINFILLLTGTTNSFLITVFVWLLITCGLFILGRWASDVYMNENKKCDPGEIVIDEVVGQLITYIITTISFVLAASRESVNLLNKFSSSLSVIIFLFLILVLPIAFFRLFDITKPLFIGKVDRECKGGFGVMIDDVMAGLIAGGLSSICIIWFL